MFAVTLKVFSFFDAKSNGNIVFNLIVRKKQQEETSMGCIPKPLLNVCQVAALLLLVCSWPAPSFALVGLPAPDFTLQDLNGKELRLSSLQSHPMVMLYFFDAASKPSQDGLITLNQLCAQYARDDLQVWAITRSSRGDVKRFAARTPITFPILIDTGTVGKRYQAERILPTTCILGPELKVLDLLHGGGKSAEIMLVRLAQRALQQRKNDFAQALSEKVAQTDPENVKARMVSAYASLNQGKLDQSESTFARLAERGGKTQAAAMEGLSAVAAKKGQAQKALSLARQVEQSDPSRGYVHVIKADVLYSQNKKQAAEKEYQKATTKNNIAPQYRAKAFNQLARIRAGQGRLEQAQSLYNKAETIDPYYIEATTNKGLLYEKQGRWDAALACFDKAQRIDKTDLFSHTLQKKLLDMLELERDKSEKERINVLVKDLAARYHGRQRKKREQTPDSWTSRPMVLSFVDFSEIGGLPEREGYSSILTVQLADILNASGRVQVVERLVVEKLLQELNLGTSELADLPTALELGKVLSAKLIVTGSLFYKNGIYLLTMRLIDTETTRIAKVITSQIAGTGSIQQDVQRLKRKILSTVVRNYPLQGYVVQAENRRVVVNLGAGQGVVPGTQFDIVEPSEPMQYRGRELHAEPKVIGQIEIVSVESDFCRGNIIHTTRPITRDDMLRERLASSKKRQV
jgi:tetratricopeptide (TPR) repeat protein